MTIWRKTRNRLTFRRIEEARAEAWAHVGLTQAEHDLYFQFVKDRYHGAQHSAAFIAQMEEVRDKLVRASSLTWDFLRPIPIRTLELPERDAA